MAKLQGTELPNADTPLISFKIKIHGNLKGLRSREVQDFLNAGLAGDFPQNLIDLFSWRGQ